MDIEQILEKTNLVRLAERAGARMRRSGNGWRGPCPLHVGDNPTAFSIYEDRGRQRWHCFTGCDAGGDAFDFVQRWYRLTNGEEGFLEAADLRRHHFFEVEEALVEMYLAGVSVRRVEDITEALWGSRVSPSTVSELNKKIYTRIETWRTRPIEGEHPYVYLDGLYLKRSWGGEVRNVSILVALAVNSDGFREILGVCEGDKEDKEGWLGFLRHLKKRGLKGVRLFISDCCLGLVESVGECYPSSRWQRCVVHFYRNVFSVVPNKMMKEVAAMLKAIHATPPNPKRPERYKDFNIFTRNCATIIRDGLRKYGFSQIRGILPRELFISAAYHFRKLEAEGAARTELIRMKQLKVHEAPYSAGVPILNPINRIRQWKL